MDIIRPHGLTYIQFPAEDSDFFRRYRGTECAPLTHTEGFRVPAGTGSPTTCKDRGKALTEHLSLCHGCPLPFIRGSALLGPSPPACGAADEAARVFARALLCNGMGLHVCACMWLHAGMGPHTRVCCGQTNRCGASGRASPPFAAPGSASPPSFASWNRFLSLPLLWGCPLCSQLGAGPCRPLIGQRRLHPALAGLSLVRSSSDPPLVDSHW